MARRPSAISRQPSPIGDIEILAYVRFKQEAATRERNGETEPRKKRSHT
jgi:hypothetical protein